MKVTIGIPAFNEEKNIASLLQSINSQVNIDIAEIIIVNDCSTDKTLDEINSTGIASIRVISNVQRMGKNTGLNIIFKEAATDLLILMDADVQIPHNSTLSLACDEFSKHNLSLSALKVAPINGNGLINKVVSFGQHLKNNYYEITTRKNNIHTCVGRTLILAKAFYKSLEMPREIVGDDAYIYLKCKTQGLKYRYIDVQTIEYKSPSTLTDFLKQNSRYENSKGQLEAYFTKDLIEQEYAISFTDKAKVSLKGVYDDTFMYALYATFYFGAKILSLVRKERVSEVWMPATSTK